MVGATLGGWADAPKSAAPPSGRVRSGLAGLGVPAGEVAVDVVLPDPVGLADPNRGQVARLDQPVHGHRRDAQAARHLSCREGAGACMRLRHVASPLSACWQCTPLLSLGKAAPQGPHSARTGPARLTAPYLRSIAEPYVSDGEAAG